jgi:hypothetical protein
MQQDKSYLSPANHSASADANEGLAKDTPPFPFTPVTEVKYLGEHVFQWLQKPLN